MSSVARRGSGQVAASGRATYGKRYYTSTYRPYYHYGYGGFGFHHYGHHGWYPYWGAGWFGSYHSGDHLFVSLGWYDAWPLYCGSIYFNNWARDNGYHESGVADEDDVAVASIELDLEPRKADVTLNGEPIGRAKDYDGRWDVLRVKGGVHELEFSARGHQTLRVYVDARRGRFYRVDEKLRRGEGVDPRSDSPPELPEATTEKRPASRPTLELRDAPRGSLASGFLRLEISPADAAVYLDGEFLASAAELDRLHGALAVAAGRHTIEVTHPRLGTREATIEVSSEATASVEIDLER